MAERVAGKAKKRQEKAPTPIAKGAAAGAGSGKQTGRLGELEAEYLRLQAELTEARARIEALETQREVLINRIDWVIDSLHSLTEE